MKSKVEPLVNLNINPCKMCMPMGSATAFYGLKNSMTILHGSQGCATYIRRHMATHYNEPVDIASSSLTEEGTVYGGSENLKKGLNNLIELYHPDIIGVMTTCLAETIGEDVPGILDDFKEEHPEYKDITLISCPSPGYGGSQYDGYFGALYSMVSSIIMDSGKNNLVNVVTAPISPGDTRYIKSMLKLFGLEAILLPDLSENLDGEHHKEYKRLPHYGTSISELKKMGGAKITLEICDFERKNSVGEYLQETYGVPFVRIPLPVGLRDTDTFLNTLSEISGKEIPEELKKERGRYLDSMIDSHKYNSAGRAAVFGEPDMVYSTIRLMCESGILPVVCATGTACPELAKKAGPEIEKLADLYLEEEYKVIDKADFKEIEAMVIECKANILVGNSDGRRIAEDLKLPLVRRGFPIHDHVGGQRLKMLGYEGSMEYMDEISNHLIDTTETSFREALYKDYYKDTLIDTKEKEVEPMISTREEEMRRKTLEHPCYNCKGHKFARIHLPVAPACNVQCKYCVRKFDCPNESRPGVTSVILTPEEGLSRYLAVKEKMPNLTVVGIAGPGEALENWESVKSLFELIRAHDPHVTFCLSTNGLKLPLYAEELAKLSVSHVTVTLNAVDPHISGQMYQYIRFMGKEYTGDAAGAIMVANQLAGIRLLVASGVLVKVNIVTVRGINDGHVAEVVKTVKDLGCFITNIMQMIPVEGSIFEQVEPISNKQLTEIRKQCEEIMPQMYHCQHCRADAVGTLTDDKSIELKGFLNEEPKNPQTVTTKYRFAVASKSGVIVDTHFGHAKEFYLYDYLNGEVRFAGKRKVEQYCMGEEECGEKETKMEGIMAAIEGCNGVIAMRIGMEPTRKLAELGIKPVNTYDMIEDAVKKAAAAM
ncbi:nitrogenase component 1 [Lacrimispora xylanolytica]|uniref:FeMo cofactor biosynthesis protein NifB n=1 Tax=Lacrimispora xylanolytica TaxID=29375 RepID=A0ABY7ACA1_9FIRM|nr:nitrogenase component 1 [Lacrimispora xylanolytica]WAJ23173.1 radical SAM protein [Lacrimispora xylanolytica]